MQIDINETQNKVTSNSQQSTFHQPQDSTISVEANSSTHERTRYTEGGDDHSNKMGALEH